MEFVPKYVRVVKNHKKYFTKFINGKQCMYSFSNVDSARECSIYLAKYKNMYGSYPFAFVFTDETRPKMIETHKRMSVSNILNLELNIPEENLDSLIVKCDIANLGLILIDEFNFKILPDGDIQVNFYACDIFSTQRVEYNHVEFLDSLLN